MNNSNVEDFSFENNSSISANLLDNNSFNNI